MTMGIYKITNTINNKSYIGLAFDIQKRWEDHINTALKKGNEENKYFYNALAKYGIDKFLFEIIEECEKEKLKEREIYWIDYYKYYNNGYNLTLGGDIGGYNVIGENHPNVKLTELDVIDIRTRYANHERRMDVYELYKHKIKQRGFIHVWQGGTWKHIMMEVYTPENKEFHKHNSAMKGINNGRSKITQQDANNIRNRKLDGEKMKDVYKDYSHLFTIGYFKNLWYGGNWNY